MALKTFKSVIVAAVESTYGTDATPTGSNAIYTIDTPKLTPLAGSTVEIKNAKPYFGNYQQLHVGSHVMLTFRVALAGSGTADVAAPWSILHQACAYDAAVENTGVDVDYPLISDDGDSLTIYFFLDGQKHAMTGARGSLKYGLPKNDIPYIEYTFTGLWVDPASVSNPTPSYAATWTTPIPVSNVNTPTCSLHGYDVILESLEIDMGRKVVHSDRPNEEAVKINNGTPSGTISFVAPALTAKNIFTIAKANTLGALAITHGTTAGNIVNFAATQVQILQPDYADNDGEVLISAQMSFVPTAAGNDELEVTTE